MYSDRARWKLRVLVFTIAIFGSVHANAYNLTGRKWFQPAPGLPVTLTYSFSNFFDGLLLDSNGMSLSDEQLRTAAEEALSLWANVAPLHFIEVDDAGGSITDGLYGDGQFGTIRMGVHAIDGFGGTKAHAFFPPWTPTPTCNLCGDVHFDLDDRWNVEGTLEFPDILGAAAHELGHALGLGHSDVGHQLELETPIFDGAVMYPTFKRMNGPGTGVLHSDDIAGIQAIYGVGVGSVTPLAAVPEPPGIAIAALLCVVLSKFILARGHCQ